MTHESLASEGIAIFGAGASGRELAWLAQERWGRRVPLRFVVDDDYVGDSTVAGVTVIDFSTFVQSSSHIPVVIAIGDSNARRLCAAKCAQAGLSFASLVHPRVEMSDSVVMGPGVVVCAGRGMQHFP
jgi:FlaA1/EpsC-like NDP-sugar epimerase